MFTIEFLILFLTCGLFAGCALHAVKYIGCDRSTLKFWVLLVAFFGAMVAAVLTPSLIGMWVAIAATTLLSAPLICHHKSVGSVEAMWKYLLICSIGIGLALFGTLLVMHGWHKPGFVFILAGYGTKMGLAPFHTWLPDAHSEAPGPVSALLSGALLNCSFLAIWRFRQIMPAAVAPFCDSAMIALGLLSLAVAAVFVTRQTDYKRMLAYSSVEHMGLILILFAIHVRAEILGAHILFHSLIKMSLFLVAGNLLLAYGTREIAAIHGMGRTMKLHAAMWMFGILMICGMPPSGLFFTEIGLLMKAPASLGITVAALLFVVFAGMTHAAIGMVFGKSDKLHSAPVRPVSRVLAFVPACAQVGAAALGIAIAVHLLAKGGL